MIQKNKNFFDLENLKIFVNNFSAKIKKGSVICLKGELGAGKTTFSRMLINKFYELNKLSKPDSIKSPTFPILLTYNLGDFEIYHYDLYRIKNSAELIELNIEENFNESITLIEWPEIFLKNKIYYKYYLIDFKIHSEIIRKIEIKIIN